MYKHLVNLCGGVPVFVDTYPDFRVTAERLRPHVTSKTKMILLNTPANPTGALLPSEELPKIAALAAEKDVLLLSDEIYDCFVYEGEAASIGAFYPKTLVMGGFSKSHAMTGWRLGYVAGPVRHYSRDGETAAVFLCLRAVLCAVRRSRCNGRGHHAFRGRLPQAARPHLQRPARRRLRGREARRRVLYLPQGPLGQRPASSSPRRSATNCSSSRARSSPRRDTHFRISYAASEETIEKGIDVLRKVIQQGPPALSVRTIRRSANEPPPRGSLRFRGLSSLERPSETPDVGLAVSVDRAQRRAPGEVDPRRSGAKRRPDGARQAGAWGTPFSCRHWQADRALGRLTIFMPER